MYQKTKIQTVLVVLFFVNLLFLAACSSGDPHKHGVAAGKAACECYKLENLDAIDACLDKIEKENSEFLTDTAYTNAVENEILDCITLGISDIIQ